MALFGISKITEDELEEIRLLKADGAVSSEFLQKIDSVMGKVIAARTELGRLRLTDHGHVSALIREDFQGMLASLGKVIAYLNDLKGAPGQVMAARAELGRLRSIAGEVVKAMDRVEADEARLLKLPILRGRKVAKKLKALGEQEKRRLRVSAIALGKTAGYLDYAEKLLNMLPSSVGYAEQDYAKLIAPGTPDIDKARALTSLTKWLLHCDVTFLQNLQNFALVPAHNMVAHFMAYLSEDVSVSEHALSFERALFGA